MSNNGIKLFKRYGFEYANIYNLCCSYFCRVSYLEIYNETMFDLLSTLPESMNASHITPMTVVEDDSGVYVKGLNCHLATSEEDALNLLFEVLVLLQILICILNLFVIMSMYILKYIYINVCALGSTHLEIVQHLWDCIILF